MHKIWKKTMAGALSACLLATGVSGAIETGSFVHTKELAQAADTDNVVSGKCGTKATFQYNKKTKTLTISGTGSMAKGYEDEDWYVEDEYYYNFLSESPYRDIIKQEMEKVVIGDGITNVGGYAFADCKALKEVKLGKKVKSIEEGAFQNCTSLKSINLSDKIEQIKGCAFYSCNKLTKLYVGKALKSIADSAFIDCGNLKQIKVHKSNKYFSTRGNMLLNKKQTKLVLGSFGSDTSCHIYGSVTSLNQYAIIIDTIENFKVSSKNKKYSSKNGLLYSKNGKTLYLCPKGKKGTATVSAKATKISGLFYDTAFEDCDKLEKIVIGKNVKSLKLGCISGCSKLKTVQINKNNKYYTASNGAIFSKDKKKLICCYYTKNGTYTVPEGLTTINKTAFNYCESLKHIVLPDDITDYEPSCFGEEKNPKIESITLGKNYYNDGNISILSKAYYLKNIYVSEENTHYSSVDGILYNKEQTKLLVCPAKVEMYKMPNTVTSVGTYGFTASSNIKELYVSDGITDMSQWKLGDVEKLHIGKNVEKISAKSDYKISSVGQFTVDPENKTYKAEDGILYTKNDNRLVWCPEGKTGAATVASGTAVIGERAFYECYGIKEIILPSTVTTIEKGAFEDMLMNNDDGKESEIIFWVPAGMKEHYQYLIIVESGLESKIVIKELE